MLDVTLIICSSPICRERWHYDGVDMDIGQLIKKFADDQGVELKAGAQALTDYVQERAARLRPLAGDLEFLVALKAAQDSAWLFAAERAVAEGDAADARVFDFIVGCIGALAVAA